MKNIIHFIHQYCQQHTSPQSEALHELERETNLKTLAPQMLSGHVQGQVLQLISQLMGPRRILEVGTFTGYAAICLAQGLPAHGKLITIEANPELEYISKKYFQKTGLEDKIDAMVGDAKQIIPTLGDTFDLVFIDAGKQDYAHFYDLVFDKVSIGGLIIADNVLWSGKVLRPELIEKDKDTKMIHAFNQKIQQDERVENVLLPLRDGLIIARKVKG
jgi:caffeoyl-CoA O-methyltransferase